jgi:hypothetical protein
MKNASTLDFATLSVALQEIRRLARIGAVAKAA